MSTQTFKGYAAVGLHYLGLEMAMHSSILACKSPWMWDLPRDSPGGQKESDVTERLQFLSFHFKIYLFYRFNFLTFIMYIFE